MIVVYVVLQPFFFKEKKKMQRFSFDIYPDFYSLSDALPYPYQHGAHSLSLSLANLKQKDPLI